MQPFKHISNMKISTTKIKSAFFALLFITIKQFGFSQCVSNFSYTLNTGGNVSFQSTSTGTTGSTNFYWNYGDGQFGSGQTTAHTYTSNGVYTINFSINSSVPSCTSNITQTISVTTAPTPTCVLNSNFTSWYGTGSSISFSSTSTGTISGTTYLWNFGDATTGSGILTSHSYTSNGSYIVKLIANNGFGCIDSTSYGIWFFNCTLSANYSFSQAGNGVINFNNTSVGTSSNTSYSWKINHVPFATGATTNHLFSNGSHSITLLVSNNSYTPTCKDSITQVITVSSNTCNLITSFTFTSGASGLVNFASTSIGTNSGMTYYWNFGDGFTSSSGSLQSHNYSNAGNYSAMLKITDTSNPLCVDSVIVLINISSVPCTANSNFTLTQLSPGNWQATPAYPYNISNATWSWGDGTFSNTLLTSHTYTPTGLYTICLTVSVSCGATSSTCATYNITKTISSLNMAHVNVVMPQTVTGINNNSIINIKNNLLIFPNPSNGNVSLNSILDLDLTIINELGQVVKTISLNSQNNRTENLSNLSEGIYFLSSKTQGVIINQKLIIVK